MVILGIDPGYAIVGWGVLEYQGNRFTIRGYGAITTPAGMDFPRRLQMIYEDMNTVLQKYRPDVLSIEKLYFTNNKTTGIDVAQARGVILLTATMHGLKVHEYTPMQVKLACQNRTIPRMHWHWQSAMLIVQEVIFLTASDMNRN